MSRRRRVDVALMCVRIIFVWHQNMSLSLLITSLEQKGLMHWDQRSVMRSKRFDLEQLEPHVGNKKYSKPFPKICQVIPNLRTLLVMGVATDIKCDHLPLSTPS